MCCWPGPATAAFAAVLASRRFRDLAFVGLALFGLALGLAGNLIGASLARAGPLRERWPTLALLARLVPVRLGLGDPGRCRPRPVAGRGGIHLLLAVALVAALWWAWGTSWPPG